MKIKHLLKKQIAQTILIGLLLCVIGMPNGYAYDFSAVCETGQTLYYNIIDAEYHYVELTYPSSYWHGYEKPTGNIILPKYVYDANNDIYFVTAIGNWAFHGCSGLTGNLIIPNYVTTIGGMAFDSCDNLTSIVIPNSVTQIGNCAFYYCIGLTGELILPNSVTTIGDYAFFYCSGLTGSLTIPDSVTSIGISAFLGCNGFTGDLTIGNSVSEIGEAAFWNCNGFEHILVESGNTVYDSRGNCNAIIKTNTNELIQGCKNTSIPNSVTTVGDYAFFECSDLTSITIPYSVTTIGNSAFSGCSGLTSITIPNSVTTIGGDAFSGCSGLTSITIPQSVTSMGSRIFDCCSGLEQILVESGNTVYDSRGNCNAIIKTNTNELIQGCKNTVIPNSVTTIGNSAFSGCSGLTSITIPNSVTTVGDYAFSECSGLTSLTIPNSVTSIGSIVFDCCSGLEQILVESGNTVYDSRGNCNAIIRTSTNELVVGCKNTVIPNTITSIGSRAFNRCRSLTSITIPNSVTQIGGYVFHGCWSLTSVTISNSVTSILNNPFYGCSELSSIIMLSITPPTIGGFSTSNNTIIYVPYESLNTYKLASNWSEHESQIQPMAYTTIPGYGDGEGNYRFIASPLMTNTNPISVDNMITETAYDLYRFDQTENDEWRNYKANNFNLINGQGYLYANAEDVNLIFKGTFNENSTKTINLIYEAGEPLAGWNLVGNPFPLAATVTGSSYYVMNEEGTGINPTPVSSGGTIPACTGIMVHATVLGQPVTFSTSAPETQSQNNGMLQIAVAENARSNAIEDKAVISFNEGDALGKFVFNKDNAQISIPQGGEEYAIACAEKGGEMPINFKATKNGSYTLSVNPEAVEMEYLHLIDNLTGNDINLLVTPSYTFEAKTSDYATRFRLVFSVYEDVDGDNEEPFAFISNGSIIVTGDYANAMLQIVDLTGRVVVSTEVANNISINEIASGVYVLRLIDGENMRTQKIVIH